MKIPISFTMFIISSFFQSGQVSAQNCNQNYGIKSVNINIYSAEKTDETKYKKTDQYLSHLHIEYDKKGREILRSITSDGFKHTSVNYFKSDTHVYTLEKSFFNGDSIPREVKEIEVLQVDSNGNAILTRQKGMTNLNKTTFIECDKIIIEVIDLKNRVLRRNSVILENNLWKEHKIVMYNHYKSDSTALTIQYHSYVFDKNNNWTYRIQRQEDKFFVETRKITYFKEE